MLDYRGDRPIEDPDDDKLECRVIAESIARCILSIPDPMGDAIAINGPWGSGKSSVVNMAIHTLRKEKDTPVIISFNSSCYRSEDGIVAGFFQEFYSGLKSDLRDSTVDLQPLVKLAYRATGVANMFGVGLDALTGMPGASGIASASNRLLEKTIEESEKIETLQKNVSKKLKRADQKILMVIDDIDRLSPEEAVAIFKLLKSVGRLSNVIYLLAYDRIETEKIIENKYKFNGNRYLEKVIQASFDIPKPTYQALENIVDERFKLVFQCAGSSNSSRVSNVMRDVVMQEVRNIRDIHRLFNMLSITFGVVKDDVDMADFIALETLRVFHPYAHHSIQYNKSVLTDPKELSDRKSLISKINDDIIKKMNKDKPSKEDKDKFWSLLASIFPPIGSSSIEHTERDVRAWNIEKRACSALHFDTYFRFSVSKEAVSESEFEDFLDSASDIDFVKSRMLKYIDIPSTSDRSKASFMLDILAQKVDSIDEKNVLPILIAIHSIADKLQYKSDSGMNFGHNVDNRMRIKWLSEKLFTMRFSVPQMSNRMLEICKSAPLNLQIEYCGVSLDYYYWEEGSVPRQQWVPFTKEDTDNYRRALSEKIADIYCRIGEEDYKDVIFKYGNYVQLISDLHMILKDKIKVESLFEAMLDISDENVLAVAKEFYHSSAKDIIELIQPRLFIVKLSNLDTEELDEEDRGVVSSVMEMFEECNEQWYEDE